MKADFKAWKEKLWTGIFDFYKNNKQEEAPSLPEEKKVCNYKSQFELTYEDKLPTEIAATEYEMTTKQYLLSRIRHYIILFRYFANI